MKYKRISRWQYKVKYTHNDQKHRYCQLRKILMICDSECSRSVFMTFLDWNSHDKGGRILYRRADDDRDEH
jgi:hypothetical protein